MGLSVFLLGLQLVGVLLPLVTFVAMFRRQQIKASMNHMFSNMSLMLTNLGCLIINASYWLLIWAETSDGAWIALKMEYLGNVLFYLSFILFVTTYFKTQTRMVVIIPMLLQAVLDGILVINLWLDDPFHIVFRKIEFARLELFGVTYMRSEPGVLYIIRYCTLTMILFWALLYTLKKMFLMKIQMERNNIAKLAGAEYFFAGHALF